MNLYELPNPALDTEHFQTLFHNQSLKIEAIRSHLTQAGEWYDQDEDEWVLLIRGNAQLHVNDHIVTLQAGENLFLPKHTRHQVLNTSKDALWLGVFYSTV
ncbi:MAG: cupin domain-containing protein [Campylobacterales bacterium]|nr:cupin domain-containing protein [Campylobacterales bacterium]